jgi:hypothetical protein
MSRVEWSRGCREPWNIPPSTWTYSNHRVIEIGREKKADKNLMLVPGWQMIELILGIYCPIYRIWVIMMDKP